MAPINLAGLWYLTGVDADERNPPGYYMEIRFERVVGRLRGAVITTFPRRGEIPLANLKFDGTRLSFKMQSYTDRSLQTLAPGPYSLVLRLVGENKFEGYSMKSQTESVGPKLKLWRTK
jgi:hypothetical protein